MLEINAVVKIKQFWVVFVFAYKNLHAQILDINEVVKIKQFWVVISLCL